MNKLESNIKHVHFIGIGGISMSGLAEILHRRGYVVSGSDWMASDITRHLINIGIDVKLGNDANYIIDGIDLVVYTAAVKPDNPEFAEARRKNINIIDRAKLLGIIMNDYEYSVAVAGVHGKTTTTTIVSEILLEAKLDPTISVGGFMQSIGSNYRVGNSPYLVMEACEYYDSFLQFYPYVGIILNIDSDHLDYFGTLERLVNSFRFYAKNIPDNGTLIIYKDTPFFEEVTHGLKCNIITYSANNPDARFWAKDIQYDSNGLPSFNIMDGKDSIAQISLNLRGNHNINNSLAAAGVAATFGISADVMVQGLAKACGAKRRFEHKGIYNEVTIVDDYCHHPTEIKACLAAAITGAHKRVICAFQSHTYTRTQNLLAEFSASFGNADIVLILPVYAAREISTGPYPNYLAERLAEGIRKNGKEASFVESFQAAANWVKENTRPGDLFITMGAGDVHVLGEGLLSGEL